MVLFGRLFFGCLATLGSAPAETGFCFFSVPGSRTAASPLPRTPEREPLGHLALWGHSLATRSGGCGWLGSDSGVCRRGTDWPAGGTVGTGQPVRTLGLGQMGTEEGVWGPARLDGSEDRTGRKS